MKDRLTTVEARLKEIERLRSAARVELRAATEKEAGGQAALVAGNEELQALQKRIMTLQQELAAAKEQLQQKMLADPGVKLQREAREKPLKSIQELIPEQRKLQEEQARLTESLQHVSSPEPGAPVVPNTAAP